MLQQLVFFSLLVASALAIKCYNTKLNYYGKFMAESEVSAPDMAEAIPCPGDSEYCITLYYTFETQKRTTLIWNCDSPRNVCSDMAKSNPPKDGNGTFTTFSASRAAGLTTRHVTCCKQDGCNYPNEDNLGPYL